MTIFQRPIDKQELMDIEARAASATGGPWISFVEGREEMSGSSFIKTDGEDIYLTGATEADQDFIAAARQDVPRLIAAVRRLMSHELTFNVGIVSDRDSGLLVAVSDDLPGLFLAGSSETQIREELPMAIREMLEARGLAVESVKADPTPGVPPSFVGGALVAHAVLVAPA